MTSFDKLMSATGMNKQALFGSEQPEKGLKGYFDVPHTGLVTSKVLSNVNSDDLPSLDFSEVGKNLPKVDSGMEDPRIQYIFNKTKDAVENPETSTLQDALNWLKRDRQDVLGTGVNIPNWALLAGLLGGGGLAALGINKLVSKDSDNEKPEEEDMNNQMTEQQLKAAAVLDYLLKQAQAKAMKAQDPTEGPAIPLRPTLNQKSSLLRLLEITRTRGLQNQDFGQHGMSSVKSAGTVEKAKDPDEKGQLEKRPDLTPGSSLQKLLLIVQSNKLKKSAAEHVVGPDEGKEHPTENNWDTTSGGYDTTRGFLNNLQLQAIQRLAFKNGLGPQDIYQLKNQLTGKPEPIASANNEAAKREALYREAYGYTNPFDGRRISIGKQYINQSPAQLDAQKQLLINWGNTVRGLRFR